MSDAPTPRERWEYCFTAWQTEKNLIADLNKLGDVGWEAIDISYNKDAKAIWWWTAFLKRRLAPGETSTGETGVAGAQKAASQEPLSGFDLPDGDFEFKE